MKYHDKMPNLSRIFHLPNLGISLLLLFMAGSQPASAKIEDEHTQARATYVAAEAALKEGQLKHYKQLKQALKQYPLYPYLEYKEIRRNLSKVSNHKIKTFLQKYPDIPITTRLRIAWLNHLGAQQRWKDYIRFYVADSNTKRQCYYLNALLETNKTDKALAQVKPIWLSGSSQPNACDPVFKAWQAAKKMTPALVWQRVDLAMNKHHTRLARYLSKFLSKKNKRLVDLWRKIYRDPSIISSDPQFKKSNLKLRSILFYGVKHLARRDASKALQAWRTLQKKHAFSPEQINAVTRYIGIRMATQNVPDAADYLAKVPKKSENKSLREWRIRVALQKSDWKTTLHWIKQLPKQEQQAENWRYWRARALLLTGEQVKAHKILDKLSLERSYYGFLSADRLSKKYQFSDVPLKITNAEYTALWRMPGIQRAHELLRLKRYIEARREWYHITKQDLSKRQLQVAAKLADRWGWHDRAIATIARARYWDDLSTRFPLAFKKTLMAKAHAQGIESAWVYAVVRQESAFITDARSAVGALGLMQLMPKTAKHVARQQKYKLKSQYALLIAETNLTLGTAYLRSVLNKLDNNPVLATAAYNAGPHRVKQWLPKQTVMPADIWVEIVPYTETRDYLRRVLSYTVIYEQRLGLDPTPLRERMRPVRKLNNIITDAKKKS